jgi:hypothetical protein
VPPVPCKEIRVNLSKDCYLDLPVTLLERMKEVRVAVKSNPQILHAAKLPHNQRKEREKVFNISFDEDGLLCVRGVAEDERWNPVLTSNTNRWVQRVAADGLVEVREIELDALRY